MDLRFETNPVLKAEQIAGLRDAVGWDGRVVNYKRILGNTYFCVWDVYGYMGVYGDGSFIIHKVVIV